MSDITICGMYTENYTDHYNNIKNDCERLGYKYHFEKLDSTYLEDINYPVLLWFNIPILIHKFVQKFDRILWLDIESRLINKLPNNWLTSTKSFTGKKSYSDRLSMPIYNSGFSIYNVKHLDFLEKVKNSAEYFISTIENKKFNYETGWNDEYLFDIIRSSDKKFINSLEGIDIDYNRDVKKDYYINRGYFIKKNTVILHPRTRIYFGNDTSNSTFVFKQNYINPGLSEADTTKLIDKILKFRDRTAFWQSLNATKIDNYTFLYDGWYFNKKHIWPSKALYYDDYLAKISLNKPFEVNMGEPPQWKAYLYSKKLYNFVK